MKFVCFNCGQVNNENNITCDNCASTLIKGWNYDDKIKELNDYSKYKNNAYSIIISVVMSFILYFGIKWLFKIITTSVASLNMTQDAIKYASLGVVALFVVFAVIPIIVKTFKLRRIYGWTSEKMRVIEKQLQFLSQASEEKK